MRAVALLALTLLAVAISPVAADAGEFGISSLNVTQSTTQAGAHADFTAGISLNTDSNGEPIGTLKDVQVHVAPGLIGDPVNIPRCSPMEFELYSCQPSMQVGSIGVSFHIGEQTTQPAQVPLYNITPSPGHLATFASSLLIVKILVQVDMSPSGGLVISMHDLSSLLPMVSTSFTLWGVPAAESHDLERWRTEIGGPVPIYGPPNEFGEREVIGIEPTPAGVAPMPFLTSSTDCAGPDPQSTVSIDSYEDPSHPVERTVTQSPPTGCDQLSMAPSIAVTPDTTQADTPAGYEVDVKMPQNESPFELATPPLRSVSVQLPAGTSLSPPVAEGLQACSDEQFGADQCPDSAKIGKATITTPLLGEALTGGIYVGTPTGSEAFRMFVLVSGDGLQIKLSGRVLADPQTGRLTVVVENAPQLPFGELKLDLFGGPGAALANPAACGQASTVATLTSYGGQTSTPSSSFEVDSDGHGGSCATSQPFAPSLSAGTLTPLAGSSSPLVLTVGREDGEQSLSTVTAQLPDGVLGELAQVPTCSEPQASAGSCAAASRIGSVRIGIGAGGQPLSLPGAVYLTEGYKGAPYGLSIVVPAAVGPFDLGTVVVRAKILVSPTDMHLTIASDPLPQILGGIPLRLRTLSLTIDRAGFILNPSDCTPHAVTAEVGSGEGTEVALSTPFQVSGCKGIALALTVKASTRATASGRGNGAPLGLSFASPKGSSAAVRSLKVDLPGQLRPRLSTIQQACREEVFAANPATCPTKSVVGAATVTTPILGTPLTGKVYLVVDGTGPSAVINVMVALANQQLKVLLKGTVGFSKTGTVSTTFNGMPDVPISSFAVTFGSGPTSMLGAIKNLCSAKLKIPYRIVGQSGAQSSGSAAIAVQGCRRKVAAKRAAHNK